MIVLNQPRSTFLARLSDHVSVIRGEGLKRKDNPVLLYNKRTDRPTGTRNNIYLQRFILHIEQKGLSQYTHTVTCLQLLFEIGDGLLVLRYVFRGVKKAKLQHAVYTCGKRMRFQSHLCQTKVVFDNQGKNAQ